MNTTDRFMKYVRVEPNGCWTFTGGRNNRGYGVFYMPHGGRRQIYAHRAAHLLFLGPIPDGMQVMHACHRGAEGCVAPHHLSFGSNADNSRDKVLAGRQPRGENAGGAKLTEYQVRAIRAATGSQEKIAAEFGISRSAVEMIRLRKRWAHVT